MHVPDRLTAWLHPPPPSAYYNTLTAFPRMLPIKFNWIKIFKFNHFQFLLIRPGLFSNPTKSIHQFSQNQSTRSSPCLFRAIMLILSFFLMLPSQRGGSFQLQLWFIFHSMIHITMAELQHFIPWIPLVQIQPIHCYYRLHWIRCNCCIQLHHNHRYSTNKFGQSAPAGFEPGI